MRPNSSRTSHHQREDACRKRGQRPPIARRVDAVIAQNASLAGLAALLFAAGAAMTISNASANTLLQSHVSGRLRGETASLYMLALRGGVSIGSLLTPPTPTAGFPRARPMTQLLQTVAPLPDRRSTMGGVS